MTTTFRTTRSPDAIWSGFTAFVAGATFSGAFLMTTLAMRLA